MSGSGEISAGAPRPALEPALKIVIVGHVDHGKSTLIGRLLHDTGSLPPGKLEELEAVSARRGVAIEWSFVLDAFQTERDQAVTIDTTQIWFRTARRDYVIIDAPGNREFLKNMVSGAASADAAIMVVDAAEGVRETSRRHAYLLHLLGIRQVAAVINKMDLVDFDLTDLGYYFVAEDAEKFITNHAAFGGVFITTSYLPDDGTGTICDADGQAFAHVFDIATGQGFFDPVSSSNQGRRVTSGLGVPSDPRITVSSSIDGGVKILLKSSAGQLVTIDAPDLAPEAVKQVYWRQRF